MRDPRECVPITLGLPQHVIMCLPLQFDSFRCEF